MVLAHDYKDGLVRVTRIPGFYHRMPINTQLAAWLTYSAEVAATLSALNGRAPFDIVDFPDWGCESYVYLLNRTEWDRVPTVIHLHGPLVMFAHAMGWPDLDSDFYRIGTAMEGTCLRLADAVFSSSDCSSDWCARHYGVARDQIPSLHTGVDTRLFYKRAGTKAARPTIIFVGRIDVNKGTDALVDAACALAEEYPTLHLQILGRGEREFVNELRAKALASGLPDLLDFAGYVTAQELADRLSRAHVFAVPSVYDRRAIGANGPRQPKSSAFLRHSSAGRVKYPEKLHFGWINFRGAGQASARQRSPRFQICARAGVSCIGIQRGFGLAPDFVLFQPTVTTLAIPLADFANPEKAIATIKAKLAQSGFGGGL